MAHIENDESPPSAIEAMLSKACADRAPWLVKTLEKLVQTHLTKTAANTTGQIALMHSRLDQVLEAVQHPELVARRITDRQAEEQMCLAAYYSDAAAIHANDRDLREGYRLLATRALSERVP